MFRMFGMLTAQAVVLATTLLPVEPAYSQEILCYRVRAGAGIPRNTVQRFAATTCPRAWAAVGSSALGQGPKGDDGDPGPAGATGPQGPQGNPAENLFNFSGASDNFFNTTGSTYFVPSAAAPGNNFTNLSIRAIPAGRSCSRVAYAIQVAAAPGTGNSWNLFLLSGPVGLPSSTPASLCSIADSQTTCSGENTVSIGALDTLLLQITAVNSPIQTRLWWNIRCVAS